LAVTLRIILSVVAAMFGLLLVSSGSLGLMAGAGRSGKPVGVFLIDRRTIVRRGLRSVLAVEADVDVVGEADGGPTVFDQVMTLRPDVILVGLGTVGHSIAEFMASVRESVPQVRVFALTTMDSEPRLVYEAIQAGLRGCLPEETDAEELVDAIHVVARGRAVLAPCYLTDLVNLVAQPPFESAHNPNPQRLSTREQEVLELVAQGKTNREIARTLFVSESTVRSHVHNVLAKLELTNRVQAAAYALDVRSQNREPKGSSQVSLPGRPWSV
jgi:two-component system NarL family response regulator